LSTETVVVWLFTSFLFSGDCGSAMSILWISAVAVRMKITSMTHARSSSGVMLRSATAVISDFENRFTGLLP
jgi:hypothetical protein